MEEQNEIPVKLDLTKETLEDLELMLKCELYRNIDSEFAKEISNELDVRLKG